MKRKEGGPMEGQGNMAEWRRGISRNDLPLEGKMQLAGTRLESQKGTGAERIREMGMPGYEDFRFSVAQFLERKEECLQNAGTSRVRILIVPKKPGLQRYIEDGVTHAEAAAFVEKTLPAIKGREENYEISVRPFFEKEYAGSIIINPDGRLRIEFRKGEHGPIAHGKEAPEFSAERSDFLPSLKYSFNDPKLRALIYDALMSIPHIGEGAHVKFTPGYYEFELVRKKEDGPLEPKFFDYQDNPAFYLKEN